MIKEFGKDRCYDWVTEDIDMTGTYKPLVMLDIEDLVQKKLKGEKINKQMYVVN